jgi:outer membrane lipoprotein-sorting protein
MKRFIVLFMAVIFLTVLCQGQSVDEIIQKNLEVKGGLKKLKEIQTIKQTGKMVMGSFEMKVTMWFKEPTMVKMEMLISEKKMTMAYDGTTAWQMSPLTGSEEPQEMAGQQAEQFKDNVDMFSDPFVYYKEKGFKFELEGKEEIEGTPAYKLKLTKKDGKVIYYFVDAESFIELKTQMTREIAEGQEMVFESFLADYKEVDGVMMAHSLSIKVNGQDQGNIVVDSVEFNVQLDDNFFKMPPKKTDPQQEPEK